MQARPFDKSILFFYTLKVLTHYKKSLYSIVIKKCTQNVKCSRFECPNCKNCIRFAFEILFLCFKVEHFSMTKKPKCFIESTSLLIDKFYYK